MGVEFERHMRLGVGCMGRAEGARYHSFRFLKSDCRFDRIFQRLFVYPLMVLGSAPRHRGVKRFMSRPRTGWWRVLRLICGLLH